jgi:putative sterol carrier protein
MAHAEINQLMEGMPQALDPSAAGDLDVVLQFILTGDKSGDFYAEIKNGKCTTHEGKHPNPTTTFTAAGEDWLDLTAGRADGMALFMQGKLSVDGDMGLAMRMQSLFRRN